LSELKKSIVDNNKVEDCMNECLVEHKSNKYCWYDPQMPCLTPAERPAYDKFIKSVREKALSCSQNK